MEKQKAEAKKQKEEYFDLGTNNSLWKTKEQIEQEAHKTALMYRSFPYIKETFKNL